MELGLQNKIALVPGAVSGVGAAIAGALCREGATTVFTDINKPGLQKAASKNPDRALAMEC
ncbi:MAG: SDR family NAD(P)-dependent oxidoreductase, partial [Spirochaetota bacterium]